MTAHYLNLAGFAQRIDMNINTLKWHRRQGHLPEPDAVIAATEDDPTGTQGWLPATVDAWTPQGPGQGARTDRRRPPP